MCIGFVSFVPKPILKSSCSQTKQSLCASCPGVNGSENPGSLHLKEKKTQSLKEGISLLPIGYKVTDNHIILM